MSRSFTSFCTAACCLFAAGAIAAPQMYDCQMQSKTANSWVSPRIAIVFDDKGGAKVIDALTLAFVGDPVAAKVRRKNGRLRVTWSIAGAVDNRGQHIPTFRYVAEITEATKTIHVIAKPVAFPQRFSENGRCTVRLGKP